MTKIKAVEESTVALKLSLVCVQKIQYTGWVKENCTVRANKNLGHSTVFTSLCLTTGKNPRKGHRDDQMRITKVMCAPFTLCHLAVPCFQWGRHTTWTTVVQFFWPTLYIHKQDKGPPRQKSVTLTNPTMTLTPILSDHCVSGPVPAGR